MTRTFEQSGSRPIGCHRLVTLVLVARAPRTVTTHPDTTMIATHLRCKCVSVTDPTYCEVVVYFGGFPSGRGVQVRVGGG